MSYNSTDFRRAVLQDSELTYDETLAALGLCEYVDWNTGIKEFETKKRRYSFFKMVSHKIGMESEDFWVAYHQLLGRYLMITGQGDDGPCLIALGISTGAAGF